MVSAYTLFLDKINVLKWVKCVHLVIVRIPFFSLKR